MTDIPTAADPLDVVFKNVEILAKSARRWTWIAVGLFTGLVVAVIVVVLLALALQHRNNAVDQLGTVGTCRDNAFAGQFDDVQDLLIVGGDGAERARARLILRGSLARQYEGCAAKAECRDGSFSQSTGSGTCSHHGGVKRRIG